MPVTADQPPWNADWAIRLRVWVERAGHAVLGPGRLELLEAIDRCHSISAAAREMGMSYRHAWKLVQTMNEAAGVPLVIAVTGGSHGGGARLTPEGQRAVVLFRQLQARLHQTAEALPWATGDPDDDAIHVAAAVSLEEVLGQLLGDYARDHPEVRVRTLLGGSDEVADHLLHGAPVDLFVTADPKQLDRLEAAGLVEATSRTVVAGNSLAAIGLSSSTLSVRKPTDLIGVRRVALADPACPLGGYTRAYLEGLGLYQSLLSRAIVGENSRAVLTAVRSGQADVGLVYGSDAREDDCKVLFRVAHLPVPIQYVAAVICRGRRPQQARNLLTFLTTRSATGRFRRCGFLAASDR
jgi:molybdate transport system substrate-binding protein